MKRLVSLALLTSLLAMASAWAKPPEATPDSVAKIGVLASGDLLLNGQPAGLGQIDAELERLKARGGEVWYFRESGQAEPPPEAMLVMELVVKHRLSVSMSTQPDFSDYVDGDGRVHPREP